MNIEDAVQQKQFPSPQVKAWINLVYTHNRVMDHVYELFKEFSITQQQYNVLRILRGRKGEPATCQEVKEVMLDKNPDLTRLGDRLVSKGLVERGVNPDNRREVQLRITREGMRLLEKIDPVVDERNPYLDRLSDKEAEQLSALLDKLRG